MGERLHSTIVIDNDKPERWVYVYDKEKGVYEAIEISDRKGLNAAFKRLKEKENVC